MQMLVIAAGVSSVAAWVYLLLGRGRFWRVQKVLHKCSAKNICAKAQNGNGLTVVAVVPARNERQTIGRCVASLFGQEFEGKLSAIVVDDQSEDGTAEAASQASKPGLSGAHEIDRLLLIDGKPAPEGWTGKVWAMQQGIEASRAFSPDYLLLTDADVVHAPDSLATLLAIAKSGAYDLASFMVKLHCQSAAERLLIPAFVFFFFMLYPPRWIADGRKKTAGAAGGCMLVRMEALERAGGMETIRGEVIDDCALARVIKKTQGLVWLGLSERAESVRAYGGFGEVGKMIARTAFNQLRHSWLLLAGALVGMEIMFLAPALLVCVYPTVAKIGLGWATQGSVWGTLGMLLGAVAWALMTLAYLPMVRWYRLNPLWAVTLPMSAVFYMGATVWSAVKYWSGRGGEWKGRAQDLER